MVMLANTPAAWSARADDASASPLDVVGWTAAGQADRFRKVLDALAPRPGETLLDWGSGTGALVDHLAGGIDYVGFDWAEGMVERARREHPGVLFVDRPYGLRADVIACVGTFNLPGSRAETWHTLRSLWYDREPRALAVSLYAGDDPRCLRYTVDETLRAIGGFSHRVSVQKWRHNDILVVISR